MTRFEDGQKVKVKDEEHPLLGKTGFVRRRRMGDSGAWVRMDEAIPDELTAFNDDRRNDVLLFPDQCEPVK